MRSKLLCLAAALALAPAALSAQDSGAQDPSARVDAALGSALDAGIPVSLLEQKIAEGKAKGVPMDRIAAAVEHRLEALTAAKDAMNKGGVDNATEGELSVAADAVQGGVSQTALAAISQESSGDNRVVAIAVLTELVAMGHVPEEALTRVQTALARGPEALANLPAEAAGHAPTQAGIGAGASGRVDVGAPRGKP
jgi:hypothetical protein